MIDRTKKLPARFFLNAAGRNPGREWILDLPAADRYTVGKDIQKVEFGWPIGRPHCAPLGKGLWEVRSSLDGNRIARVIFFAWATATWFCTASSRRRRGRTLTLP
jgi:phage-related protein